jgi:hypothetical protein
MGAMAKFPGLAVGWWLATCLAVTVLAQDKGAAPPSSAEPARESAPINPPAPATQAPDQEPASSADKSTTDPAPAGAEPSDHAEATVRLSEQLLPANTRAWLSVPDAEALDEALRRTDLGHMMEDSAVEPFISDLSDQIRKVLNERNMRFGMEIEDLGQIDSGEICFAGILIEPAVDTEGAKPDSALVLMVDVSQTQDAAKEVIDRVNKNFIEREGTQEEYEVAGVKGYKWSFKKPRGLRKKQFAYHAIAGSWLIATDHEGVFREIVERIVASEPPTSNLETQEIFQRARARCELDEAGGPAHVRWFIEPFGYIDLAQAIADEQRPADKQRRDNFAEIFKNEGFSAIKGVAGNIRFADGAHDIAHRTFVYAPPVPAAGEDRFERAAGILDFDVASDAPLAPPDWIPSGVAAYADVNWDLPKVVDKIGTLIDALYGGEGSFERLLHELEHQPNGPRVSVRKLVASLESRVTIASVIQTPITEDSEKMVVGIKIRQDESFVRDAVKRLVGSDGFAVPFGEYEMIVLAREQEEELDELEFEFEAFGDESAEEEQKPHKPLFEKLVFVVAKGWLFVCNDEEFLRSVVTNMDSQPGQELVKAADYQRVATALDSLIPSDQPSMRQFGRLSVALRANYEMMRQGKMVESNTLLARVLNRILTPEDAEGDTPREQVIDGSKMPEDFDTHVAKYLGPAGTVMQTLDDGWLITGVLLKAEPESEEGLVQDGDESRISPKVEAAPTSTPSPERPAEGADSSTAEPKAKRRG